jgi:hypothetical protein
MCDYSLAALRTRLAAVGEELVVYRFPTGSLGFTSPRELEIYRDEVTGWRSRFNPRQVPCAVCIPPGARLLLQGIPRRLRWRLGLKASEEVVFVQTHELEGRHRDGVRFWNNQEILLQHLAESQRALVLSLSSCPESEEETALEETALLTR